jgi:hypothetical protein
MMPLCEYNLLLKSFNVSNSFNKVGITEKLKIIMNLFQDTVGQLHKRACKVFDLVPAEVVVYFDVTLLLARIFFIVIVAIIGRYAFGTIMVEQSIH